MKMYYGNVPVKSMNIHHFEMDTNDCDMVASDMQAGKTAVARGQKITGTGKCFEFASYGRLQTNLPMPIPNIINTLQIGSLEYPVQMSIELNGMKNLDFTTSPVIGNIVIGNTVHPITVTVANNLIIINCDNTINLEVFYGKDNYV